MAGDDILKGSKLSKMLAGRSRPVRRFDLEVVREGSPETLRLAVRTISAEEQLRVQGDAKKYLATVGWSREDMLTDIGAAEFNLAVMVHTLAVAFVDYENPELPFATISSDPARSPAAEVARCFEVDEIRACFDEYSAHVMERSPFRYLQSLGEAREVADALGKGLTSTMRLPRYDSTFLRLIITSLAERVTTLTTPKSSATSQPTDSPDDSSPSSTPSRPVMTVSEG